eukprot:4603365-Pleurochrysis_carterae.AAC.4
MRELKAGKLTPTTSPFSSAVVPTLHRGHASPPDSRRDGVLRAQSGSGRRPTSQSSAHTQTEDQIVEHARA